MKLSLTFLSTLLTLTTAVSIPSNGGSDAGGECSNISESLGDKPTDLLEYFQEQVCGSKDKCTSTVGDQNDFLQGTILPQLLKEITQRLDASAGQQKKAKDLASEIQNAVKQSCSQTEDAKICDDQDGTVRYGQCALKAAEPVLRKDQPSGDQCKNLKEVFADDELWTKTFRGYVDEYADECKNKNGGDGEDDDE